METRLTISFATTDSNGNNVRDQFSSRTVCGIALSKSAPESSLGSNLAKHEQDQQNNNHKAEGATPVVASAVKRAAAEATKAAQQCDDQDDENDSPN
jgi:hypothetical protein